MLSGDYLVRRSRRKCAPSAVLRAPTRNAVLTAAEAVAVTAQEATSALRGHAFASPIATRDNVVTTAVEGNVVVVATTRSASMGSANALQIVRAGNVAMTGVVESAGFAKASLHA